MLLSPFEWTVTKRYMMPGKGEGFIALVAGISIGVVMLSVALLIVVMSVMNGFRGELLDRFVNLNGHAIIQGYGGRLDNWEQLLEEVRETPDVTSASPLIEQPLLVTFNGRAEAINLRGNTQADIAKLSENLVAGNLSQLKPEAGKIAIGSRLAIKLGAQIGDIITIINPQGRSTPFGTVPRQVGYEIAALIETGVYDFDQVFVIMPIKDAQTLLLTGDTIGLIEVMTTDAEDVGRILQPLQAKLQGRAQINDWRTLNSSIFEALEVERAAMFFALSLIVLVAAFNILSSLVMLVRAKTRDIAIMRTMGATRRNVLKIFVTTGTVIGAFGTLSGLVLGFLILYFRQAIVSFFEMVTGQALWDPSVRFLTELPARVDPAEVVGICLLAMVLSFLATLYPAYKAANTDPVQVLRYE
ncbi:lipoprotein-releasing ABC transporter permease subunit [Pontixanthobacter gangjinensis]|uniref:Lipoprotein-releasing ABC transporter permease subunit n=1 Tax=Pontixanthobacter gangjinensis TaxID=1028742 RepID=A0A6I4SPR7_9SPHN|nr:lipoprotein-releasing ABC transporter permease subunit [Pontixanthobacter gangjinensis]MXO56837.1 lipoprotein-releasing ABC transporter permease subunit [Pontixanthobacter gangjinensis]